MVYRVSLIECGRVSHSWFFSEYLDAIRHMEYLCHVFDEVNEVFPIMVKSTSAEANHPLKGYINNIIIN